MRRGRFLGLVLAASMLVGAAACSSDDDTSASSSSSSSSESTRSESSSSDSDSSLSSASVQGGGNATGTAGCVAASVAYGQAIAAAGLVLAGQSADIQSQIDALRDYQAPDEIRDDLQTIVNAYVAYVNALQASGYSPSAGGIPSGDQIAAIAAAGESLNTEEVSAAGERVQQYFDANCPN